MFVQGLQTITADDSLIALGPFVYPLSGIASKSPLTLTTSYQGVTVPTGVSQLLVIPPEAGTETIIIAQADTDTGMSFSPLLPIIWPFDTTTPAVPTTIYLKAAGAVTVLIQFS